MADDATAVAPAAEQDHRHARRQRVLLGGKLIYGEADLTLDCAIRDLTDAGARIRLLSPEAVPSELWLVDTRTGRAFLCRVAWRHAPEYGLEFLETHDLSCEDDTPRLRLMKRIWVEHAAR